MRTLACSARGDAVVTEAPTLLAAAAVDSWLCWARRRLETTGDVVLADRVGIVSAKLNAKLGEAAIKGAPGQATSVYFFCNVSSVKIDFSPSRAQVLQ